MDKHATTAAQTLATFAAGLRLEDVPAAVIERAKDCIIDTVAVATYGARFPGSRMLVEHAKAYGRDGKCSVLGNPGLHLSAPYAALANGGLTHAAELDNLGPPGAGLHAGACVVPAALAAAEETGADGRAALLAFIAGTEVMFRIGAATTPHPPDRKGFHGPGLTGPYGAAVAASLVYGLTAGQLVNAMGIAGSLSGGLLAYTQAKQGSMVKRLHMARGCESGILAARLAQRGYEGPETILEGKFGFLQTYCGESAPERLTAGLREDWEVMRIVMKPYACHVTSQPAVENLCALMRTHGFSAGQVAGISVQANERIAHHHAIAEPIDLAHGQHSLPFNLALALHRNIDDPSSYDDSAVRDPGIRAMCRSIQVTLDPDIKGRWGSRVQVRLKDGREFAAAVDSFKGMPSHPLNREELRRKFGFLTRAQGAEYAKLFDHLAQLETRSVVLP